MTTGIAEKSSAPQSLMQMLTGFWIFQAVHVAAKLGVADQLQTGPLSIDELAHRVSANGDALYRVMRALTSVGIFSETGEKTYVLTPVSDLLRAEHPGSMRPVVLMLGEINYPAWGYLPEGVQSGKIPFELAFGTSPYEYFKSNPKAGETFNAAMAALVRNDQAEIAEIYDFSVFANIVDVGGGNGMLLATLLNKYPGTSGILFELPQVIGEAKQNMQAMNLEDRCQFAAGDFFESVAEGGDAYLLSHIIHTFSDEQCESVLRNVHRAMPCHGRLLIIEDVLKPENDPSTAKTKFMDINMLVFTPGGREHTREEFERMLDRSGFTLTNITTASSGTSVIEAVKK